MSHIGFDQLTAEIAAISSVRDVGRVVRIGRGSVEVAGLSHVAAQGDLVEIAVPGNGVRRGEVLNLAEDLVTVLPDGDIEGLQIGAAVELHGANQIAPDDSWIGRVIDPMGGALDGRPLMRGARGRPLRGGPVNPTQRRVLGQRLETGLAVFNTLLPIVAVN